MCPLTYKEISLKFRSSLSFHSIISYICLFFPFPHPTRWAELLHEDKLQEEGQEEGERGQARHDEGGKLSVRGGDSEGLHGWRGHGAGLDGQRLLEAARGEVDRRAEGPAQLQRGGVRAVPAGADAKAVVCVPLQAEELEARLLSFEHLQQTTREGYKVSLPTSCCQQVDVKMYLSVCNLEWTPVLF